MSFVDFFTIFSAIFGVWVYYFQSSLQNKDSSVSLVDALIRHNYFEFYKSYLKLSLDKIDSTLGKPTWSWMSIGN